MKRYLLPCRCGASTPVEAAQAGLQVRCQCGVSLDVPTWAQLRKLPLAPADNAAPTASDYTWGPRQGLRFLGTVVVLLGLVLVGIAYLSRPLIRVDLTVVQKRGAELTPAESWNDWMQLRQGLSPHRLVESEEYLLARAAYQRNLNLSCIVTGLGVAILVASWFAGRQPPRS